MYIYIYIYIIDIRICSRSWAPPSTSTHGHGIPPKAPCGEFMVFALPAVLWVGAGGVHILYSEQRLAHPNKYCMCSRVVCM